MSRRGRRRNRQRNQQLEQIVMNGGETVIEIDGELELDRDVQQRLAGVAERSGDRGTFWGGSGGGCKAVEVIKRPTTTIEELVDGEWDEQLQLWVCKGKKGGVQAAVQGGNGNGNGKGGYHPPVAMGNWRKCDGHSGRVGVHEYADGTVLSGASRMELDRRGVDLLIDCGVGVENIAFTKGTLPQGFEGLAGWGLMPRIVRLDWPDRTVPFVGLDFWRMLRSLFQPKWNVVCCCFGGHGRTGTALASLLIEDGIMAHEAIRWVRDVHCEHAIETKGQEAYLVGLEQEAIEWEAQREEEQNTEM